MAVIAELLVEDPPSDGPDAADGTRRSMWASLRSPKIFLGLLILTLFVAVGIFGPILDHTNPSALSAAALQGPSRAHLLGTTQTGQDVFAQLVDGARVSLLVGVVAATIAQALSLLIGLSAGYLGGLPDELLSTLSNVFLVIPSLPLVIVLAGYLPSKGSLSVAVVISVTGWAWGARVLRAQTLSIRNRDFVEAARATGERPLRVIFAQILPNELAIVASGFLFTLIFAILTQASLAFLGLSNVSSWSWGTMLFWAQTNQALQVGAWWWFIPPGLCIALVGSGLALVNFGIDEFVNPRLRVAGVGTKKAGRAFRREHNQPQPGTGTGTNGHVPPRAPGGEAAPDARGGPPAFTPVNRAYKTGPSRDTAVTTVVSGKGGRLGPPVLEVSGLSVDYGVGGRALHAVDGIDLVLHRGEVLGIAGESGSGKSTLAFAMTRLLRPPGLITAGQVRYHPRDGPVVDVLDLSEEALRLFRWDELAIVFQSAMNALNPILSLRVQLDDTLRAHRPAMGRGDRAARIGELLSMVGLSGDRAGAYPHELSGGMRQRAMIAIALALEPDIIVMDEPTTALDVVTQRQILAEIMKLRERLAFSVIFITHDLSLLIEVADTIAVMYAGKVVELSAAAELYRTPRHPYSYGLLNSFPLLHGAKRTLTGIPGSPPDLKNVPPGCSFHPRCSHAMTECYHEVPALEPTASPEDSQEHRVACLLYDQRVCATSPITLGKAEVSNAR